MSIQQILTSLYIKDGAKELMNSVQTCLQKKKGKKLSQLQQILPLQSSVVNFIILPKRPTIPYFQQQLIRSLQGKTRSSIFQVKNEDDYLAEINKFRLLYKKYLVPPKNNLERNQEYHLGQAKRILGLRLFSQCYKDDQIQILSQKTSKIIQEKRKCIVQLTNQLIVDQSKKAPLKDTLIDHIIYCQQVTKDLFQKSKSILHAPQYITQRLQNYEEKINARRDKIQEQWLMNLMTVLNLKELLSPSKMISSWPSNLLEKQKQQIIANQITGKMLFQIEEKIRKAKQMTNKIDFNHQYQFRQKSIGIHSFMHQEINKYSDKTQNFQEFSSYIPQKSVIDVGLIKGKSVSSYSQCEENNYVKMAERLHNLKKKQAMNQQYSLQQKHKYLKPSAKPASIIRTNPSLQNQYHNFNLKSLKSSPLRLKYLEKYSNQPANIKKQSIPKKQIQKEFQYRQAIQNIDKPKKMISFPIKIQHFQMISMQDSFLSYPIDSINLKQLPLQFLKDRHKFSENRVKIEYPCRADSSIQQLVRKSMQILNCLGAEIFCQEQISYKNYHSVDQDQILAVSWLIHCPVKDVIKFYSDFFGKCPTKK